MHVSDAETLRALERMYPAADLADGAFDWSSAPSVVKGAPPALSDVLSQSEDAFQRDVLTAAKTYFSAEAARRGVSLREATKATPARWLQLALLTAATALSCVALMRGWWPAVVVAPVLVWILQAR